MNPWPSFDLLWIAGKLGYFDLEEVEVRLLDFEGLADGRLALDRGMLDGFLTTSVDLAFTRVPVRPVWVLDRSLGGDALLAAPQVRGLADLRGRRIALEEDSVNALVLHSALAAAGLEPGDVLVRPMGQLVAEEQFRSGTLDALITYPPVLTRLEALPGVQRLYDSRQMPQPIYDIMVMREDVASVRAEAVAALVRALQRALALLQTDPAQVHALIAARHHTDPATVAASFRGLEMYGAEAQAALLKPGGPVDNARDYAWETLPSAPSE
ncbi:MAG: hypothetical protein RL026_116 [Pseudomonadota bacterium]